MDQAFIRAYARLNAGTPAPKPLEPQRQPPEPQPPRQPPKPPRQRSELEGEKAVQTTYICDAAQPCPPAPHGAIFEVVAEDRQPLSAFVRLTPSRDAFQAAVQVEQFSWPAICGRIAERLRHGLDHAADQLVKAAGEGRRVVAVTGCRRGEGCTTTLLCLARHLATAELPVAMVDADFQKPELAERLGIATPAGWEDVLRDQLPLADAVVSSVQDHVSLLPVRTALVDAEEIAGNLPASISLRVLRHHYGMVLVDLGPVLDASVAAAALKLAERSGIDAALLVRDARVTSDDELREATRSLTGAGVTTLGVAETFVATAVTAPRTDAAHTIQIATRGRAQPARVSATEAMPRFDVRQL
jgi:Mrp family chromosome partitioning ATPase